MTCSANLYVLLPCVEGTIGELHAKGWRRISRKKGGRWKEITECPQHNGVMTGRER